jgi:hypothetical protein
MNKTTYTGMVALCLTIALLVGIAAAGRRLLQRGRGIDRSRERPRRAAGATVMRAHTIWDRYLAVAFPCAFLS